MRVAVVVVAVALGFAVGGCVYDQSQTCEGGVLCPNSLSCAPDGSCIANDLLAACEGKNEQERCTISFGNGVCVNSVCTVAICGNGRIEGAEICDDGNNISGDECNATCSSDERCGNGQQDPGEECDCGDALPANSVCSGQLNGEDGGPCRSDCINPTCGDGVVDPFEDCDDGNTLNDDDCVDRCRNAECGDGYVWVGSEECDDDNSSNNDECTNTCKLNVCGDHMLNPSSEECDSDSVYCSPVDCDWGCPSGQPCYQVIPTPTRATTAKTRCDDLGLTLASVLSDDANEYVTWLLHGQAGWLGLTATQGVYAWTDRTPFGSYIHWKEGQGTNATADDGKFAEIAENGDWLMVPSNTLLLPVCKKSL